MGRDVTKVVVFRNELLPSSETFVKQQLRALQRHEAVLVGYQMVREGLSLDGLVTHLLPGCERGFLSRRCLRSCQFFGMAHPSTVKALTESSAVLVHVHFGPDAVDVWPSVRRTGLPMLVTLHGYDINTRADWWTAGNGGLRQRFYPRRLLTLSKESRVHFLAVSKAIRNQAIQYGLPPEKITVHYIGIDTTQFRPCATPVFGRPKRVLFVGRLVEKKGVSNLINAARVVADRVPGAQFVIGGDGPEAPRLKQQAEELGVPVRFLGRLTADEVRSQMDRARVFCLPSVTARNGDAEGLPIVLLEAQASGLPVVTSAKGGSTEGMQDGKTGFRFTEKNEHDLAVKLEKLLMDDVLLSRFSGNAADFVRENFDIKSQTKKLEAIYDRLADN